MLVVYLFLDENDVCFEAALFDTDINNGEVPDFIRNRPDIKKIITTYRGEVHTGWKWDGTTLVDPNPPPPPPPSPSPKPVSNTTGPTVV